MVVFHALDHAQMHVLRDVLTRVKVRAQDAKTLVRLVPQCVAQRAQVDAEIIVI